MACRAWMKRAGRRGSRFVGERRRMFLQVAAKFADHHRRQRVALSLRLKTTREKGRHTQTDTKHDAHEHMSILRILLHMRAPYCICYVVRPSIVYASRLVRSATGTSRQDTLRICQLLLETTDKLLPVAPSLPHPRWWARCLQVISCGWLACPPLAFHVTAR